jgi:hypothetical protein
VKTSTGAPTKEIGSEDGNVTHRSKSRGWLVKVRRVEAIVHRRWVLRRERRWATGGAVRTDRTRTRFPAESVGCKRDGPGGRAEAIGEQGEDHCEEDEDRGAKRWGVQVWSKDKTG